MTTLSPALELIGRDLDAAVRRVIVRRQRRRRTLRVTGAALTVAAAFCAVAVASGIAPELNLDPGTWTILHRGNVDGGKGAYVHATENGTGRPSVFMVEHDAGLDRYAAFLLHEQTLAAANAAEADSGTQTQIEPGPLCTRAQVTRAEVVALGTLRASFAPGTPADVTAAPVDAAVRADFRDTSCRGLEYAGEQARLVYAGNQPAALLMPGAR